MPELADVARSELDTVRDAIGVYRSCTEANQQYYDAIVVIVDYAERTIVVESRLSFMTDDPAFVRVNRQYLEAELAGFDWAHDSLLEALES